jgi:hypothetical protein
MSASHAMPERPHTTWGVPDARATCCAPDARRPDGPRARRRVRAGLVVLAVAAGVAASGPVSDGLPAVLGCATWPAWIGVVSPLLLVLAAYVSRVVLLPAPGEAATPAEEAGHGR